LRERLRKGLEAKLDEVFINGSWRHRFQALSETLAQAEQTRRFFGHLFLRNFASFAETDDTRHV